MTVVVTADTPAYPMKIVVFDRFESRTYQPKEVWIHERENIIIVEIDTEVRRQRLPLG